MKPDEQAENRLCIVVGNANISNKKVIEQNIFLISFRNTFYN